MKPSSKPIVIMTATGQGNLGDELILTTEIRAIRSVLPEHPLIVFSHDISSTLAFLRYQKVDLTHLRCVEFFPNRIRQHPFRNVLNLIQTHRFIARAGAMIIGGGGLIYEKQTEGGTRRSPVLNWRMRTRIARRYRVPVVYWSVGIGTDRFLHELFFDARILTVRDDASVYRLKTAHIPSIRITDPVFLFTVEHTPRPVQKTLGFALRSKGLDRDCIVQLAHELTQQGYRIVGLPHSIRHDDISLNDRVFLESCGITCPSDIISTLEAYQNVDAVVTNRFHGIVLSLVHGLPVLPITVNEKTTLLSKSLQIKYLPTCDIDEVRRSIQDLAPVDIISLVSAATQDTNSHILLPLCDLL